MLQWHRDDIQFVQPPCVDFLNRGAPALFRRITRQGGRQFHERVFVSVLQRAAVRVYLDCTFRLGKRPGD